jgi:hypothetical protein
MVAVGLVVAGLVVPPRPAQAADGFTQITVEAGRNGDCKGLADIDGDGLGDPFIGSAKLSWYHSPGGNLGGSWVRHDIGTATTAFTTQCAPADVNGDGAPDIVTPDTGASAGPLLWFENPRGRGGNPATDPWVRHEIGSPTYFMHDVAVADLDGNGRLDVVTRSTTLNFDIVDLWTQVPPVGTGAATWTRRQLTGGPAGLGLAVGDVDMDGRADLVTGGSWRHNPDWALRSIAGSGEASPAIADFNGDGRNDVALSSMEYTSVDVAYYTSNTPSGGGWVKHVIDPTVRLRGHTIFVADFDANGRPDLLVGYMADPWVTPWPVNVYLNPGAASPTWTKLTLSTAGGHNMVAGDMNGDGRPEVFGSMYGSMTSGVDNPPPGQVPGTPGAFAWRNDTGAAVTTTTSSSSTSTSTSSSSTSTTAPTTTVPTTTTSALPVTTTTTTTAPQITRYEAELATLSAGVDGNDAMWCPCSNNRAVGDFREPGETVRWTVTVSRAGTYRLTWRYAAADAAAPRRLDVNGTVVSATLTFPRTATWAAWSTTNVSVTLQPGANTVTLTAGTAWAYQNLDYLEVG